jgi:hypothetical protein
MTSDKQALAVNSKISVVVRDLILEQRAFKFYKFNRIHFQRVKYWSSESLEYVSILFV